MLYLVGTSIGLTVTDLILSRVRINVNQELSSHRTVTCLSADKSTGLRSRYVYLFPGHSVVTVLSYYTITHPLYHHNLKINKLKMNVYLLEPRIKRISRPVRAWFSPTALTQISAD